MGSIKPIPQFSEIQAAQFWARVDSSNTEGCWPWTGSIQPYIGNSAKPYGVFYRKRIGYYAHRIAYTLASGPIPEGLTIDHVRPRCTNTLCCRPDHLEPVTGSENAFRRVNSCPTVCTLGHIRKAGTRCSICRSMAQRKYNLSKGIIKDPDRLRTGYTDRHLPADKLRDIPQDSAKSRSTTVTHSPIAALTLKG